MSRQSAASLLLCWAKGYLLIGARFDKPKNPQIIVKSQRYATPIPEHILS